MTILTAILQGPLFDDGSDSSGDSGSSSDSYNNDSSSSSGTQTIDSNQYTYLTNLVNNAANDPGNAAWAQNQLNTSTYTPNTSWSDISNGSSDTSGYGNNTPTSDSTPNTTPSSGSSLGPMGNVPGYGYTTPSGNQVTGDGQIHASINNTAIPDIKVSQGSSFGSAQDIASAFGGSYVKDNNGNYIITKDGKDYQVNPIGFDKYGNAILNYRDVAERMGYQVKYDDASNTVTFSSPNETPKSTVNPATISPQVDPNKIIRVIPGVGAVTADGKFVPFGQGGISGTGGLPGMNPNLQPTMPQIQPFQAPDLSNYQSQIMPYQQFNPDWNNYYNSAKAQLDPQYQAQVQKLMDKQATDITSMNDTMNRRGIFTSGLAQAAENDLRAKTSNSVAQVFINEQGAIEKAAQNLYNDAYKQYQQGNDMALKNNEFMMTQMMNERKFAFDQWLKTQQLSDTQYNYALHAWDSMSNYIMQSAKLQQTGDIANQKNYMDLFKFDNLSADQQATLNQQAQKIQLDAAKTYGFDANGRPTLDMWKALGYVQTPDGKLIPTQAATNETMTYALNLAKAQGYFTNPDGSITPTEQARHDLSTEQFNQQKLAADIQHWATQDQLSNARIGLDQQKLAEKANYDQNMIAKAQDSAIDSMKRTQLDGYKAELSSITQQINGYIAAGKAAPDALIQNYNNVMQNVSNTVGGGTGG